MSKMTINLINKRIRISDPSLTKLRVAVCLCACVHVSVPPSIKYLNIGKCKFVMTILVYIIVIEYLYSRSLPNNISTFSPITL